MQVFGSADVTGGEKFQLSVVAVDPLTTEVILGLDILSQCTVDLLHKQLIYYRCWTCFYLTFSTTEQESGS